MALIRCPACALEQEPAERCRNCRGRLWVYTPFDLRMLRSIRVHRLTREEQKALQDDIETVRKTDERRFRKGD